MSKVLSVLGGALPDERPVLSLQIVESIAKCPAGYWPVNRTYDEDADAGLLRQNGIFGKKPSHYICLSKSEGVPGYVMDGVRVVGEREAAPAGFGVAGRAGKRRLCTRVCRAAAAREPVTDLIVCSSMRQAPHGFILAGEINGKIVCYKVGGGSGEVSPAHAPAPAPPDYENVLNTPDAHRRGRAAPERPPNLSPLITELGHLQLKGTAGPEEGHDYEALSPSYSVKPARPAPRPPPPTNPAASGAWQAPRAPQYATLGGLSGLEGVPFELHPRLRGLPPPALSQFPVIKHRTRFELDRDYSYNFTVERQT